MLMEAYRSSAMSSLTLPCSPLASRMTTVLPGFWNMK